MITLHISLWTDDKGQDRFTVLAADASDPENMKDVTDEYELTAAATPEGRPGFAVFRKEPRSYLKHADGTVEEFVPKKTGQPVNVEVVNVANECGGAAHPHDGRCDKCGAQIPTSDGVCRRRTD